jgi:acetate kinase
MKILVANLGSTSFKYSLFDMTDERELARGGIERIGGDDVPDHGMAIDRTLRQLVDDGALRSLDELAGIGFKAVHGGGAWDTAVVTDEVLTTMETFSDVAPAHNPAYVSAMRSLRDRLPDVPQVAAFETGFHRTIPEARQLFGIPYEWSSELGVRRYGFHGASHRYIAGRTAELLERADLKLISCHLGGSSSICAIDAGRSVANSFAMTPQSGLPHNNRVGDFDVYAMLKLLDKTEHSFDELLDILAKQGGLLGISGVSNDLRDIEQAAEQGNERARLAIDVLVESIRNFIGAFAVALGGIDVIAFTGGIGENAVGLRTKVCAGMDFLGVRLDETRNQTRGTEATISSDDSSVRVMIVPTNEELVVARQTKEQLSKQ